MSSTPAARAFLIFTAAIVGTAVLSIALLFATIGNTEETVDQSEQNFDAIKDAETILRVMLAVTGCTAEDTPEQCRQRLVDATRAEGAHRIAEIDCRMRLALAGQEPPAPGRTCIPPPATSTTTTPVPVAPPP